MLAFVYENYVLLRIDLRTNVLNKKRKYAMREAKKMQQYLPSTTRERILDLMKEQHMTQKDLAERIGCARSKEL